jgi:DNA-binding transcriptional LysR family regulator
VPGRPEDLDDHDGLLSGPAARTWRLKNNDGEEVPVTPAGRLVADESSVLLRAAATGLGVGCLPEAMTAALVGSGDLATVLPDWTAGTVTTTLLTPHRRSQLPAVRAVVDFLAGA